jgi:hypothetical protein
MESWQSVESFAGYIASGALLKLRWANRLFLARSIAAA